MDQQDRLIPLVDERLGNSAYLLDLDDGRSLAVDRPWTCAPSTRPPHGEGCGSRTRPRPHLHADFLSRSAAAFRR